MDEDQPASPYQPTKRSRPQPPQGFKDTMEFNDLARARPSPAHARHKSTKLDFLSCQDLHGSPLQPQTEHPTPGHTAGGNVGA